MDFICEELMQVICDHFCKYRGNECNDDTGCFLDDAIKDRLREALKEDLARQAD